MCTARYSLEPPNYNLESSNVVCRVQLLGRRLRICCSNIVAIASRTQLQTNCILASLVWVNRDAVQSPPTLQPPVPHNVVSMLLIRLYISRSLSQSSFFSLSHLLTKLLSLPVSEYLRTYPFYNPSLPRSFRFAKIFTALHPDLRLH